MNVMKFADIELPSNRKFGYFCMFIFGVGGIYLYDGVMTNILYMLSALFGATLVVTLAKPSLLLPFNKGWMWIGYILGRVVSPVVLGAIFFFLITPVALIFKISGRDELRLKLSKAQSHWRERSTIGPDAESLKNQF